MQRSGFYPASQKATGYALGAPQEGCCADWINYPASRFIKEMEPVLFQLQIRQTPCQTDADSTVNKPV
jgi:hypothetical protein